MKLFLEKIKIKDFLKTCNKNVSILIPHPESYEDYKKLKKTKENKRKLFNQSLI